MNEKVKVTPKDFFLWLGVMAALYFSVGSFATLLFEYIERLFGAGAIVGYDPYSGGIRFAIAALIVIFPVYIALTRMLNQNIRKNPEKKDLWVRRWAIFLTVFLAGVGLVIDLIVLIHTFLGGEELTAAFLLKVLTIFVLFGGVFYYYLQDIKGAWEHNEKLSVRIGYVVVAVVIASIIGGFFVMGSPATQRQLREDQQRIDALENIQYAITDYYTDKEALPETLEDLKDPLGGRFIENDPATGEPYEYEVTGKLTFSLCATFAQPLPDVNEDRVDRTDWRVKNILETREKWGHDEGRTCFEREVDPDRHSKLKIAEPVLIR